MDMRAHFEGAKKFAAVYSHLSEDPSPRRSRYELECFQRWFVLMDFMKTSKLREVGC